MKDYAVLSTVAVCGAVWVANGTAFVQGPSAGQVAHGLRSQMAGETMNVQVSSAYDKLGCQGLLAYGAGAGMMAALFRGVTKRSRTQRKAGEMEVATKSETKPTVAYLENVPRTIVEKNVLDKLLAITPKEEWENPEEGTEIYVLKQFAEAYGEGKATKMGWYDYLELKFKIRRALDIPTVEQVEGWENEKKALLKGEIPLFLPGAFGLSTFDTGATIKWRGATEPMAADTVRTLLTDGRFAKNFVDNWAFYREGLEPWQRGLEIGMGHGYFLIGPFTSLGPLRFTPEAATVGLLSGVAVVVMVSIFGLVFSTVEKPRLFDKPGQKRGTGFTELINWHMVGGIGGAGFAHALITVFGNS